MYLDDRERVNARLRVRLEEIAKRHADADSQGKPLSSQHTVTFRFEGKALRHLQEACAINEEVNGIPPTEALAELLFLGITNMVPDAALGYGVPMHGFEVETVDDVVMEPGEELLPGETRVDYLIRRATPPPELDVASSAVPARICN